jgi:ATP-binding cassette subfamily G (WHITE) protein 2 (SNQ2)
MKVFFHAVATWFSDPTPAQSAAGVSLLALTLYTGYNIPEPYTIGALRWITCINVRIYYLVLYVVRLTFFPSSFSR